MAYSFNINKMKINFNKGFSVLNFSNFSKRWKESNNRHYWLNVRPLMLIR